MIRSIGVPVIFCYTCRIIYNTLCFECDIKDVTGFIKYLEDKLYNGKQFIKSYVPDDYENHRISCYIFCDTKRQFNDYKKCFIDYKQELSKIH